MTSEAGSLWNRALRSLATASEWVSHDPDAAASRAYYAAFYGVSALFTIEGRSFAKHTALEAAVHRDLVKTGRCPMEFGEAFSMLSSLRATADYGVEDHVTVDGAKEAVANAAFILNTLRRLSPELLP